MAVSSTEGRRRERGGSRPDRGSIEAALVEVAARHPDVLISAVVGDGAPTAVAVPESVPVPRQYVMPPMALAASPVPSDLGVVAAVWLRARTEGMAAGRIRLSRTPERMGELHGFDLREGHGVVIFVYLPPEAVSTEATAFESFRANGARRSGGATKNAGGVNLSIDSGYTELLGWTAGEVVGHQAAEFVHPDDLELAVAAWVEMLSTPGYGPPIRVRQRHRDGSWVWVEVVNENRLEDPRYGDVRTTLVDVAEEMAAIEALQKHEQLFGQVAETVPVGLFAASVDGRLLFVNRRLSELTVVHEADTLDGQFATLEEPDRELLGAAVARAHAGEEVSVEVTFAPTAERHRHCLVALRPLTDFSGVTTGVTGCVSDVTEMVASRRALETRASSDPLTGCANRGATLSALDAALARLADVPTDQSSSVGVAVLFMDVDGLKTANDRYGHAAGDRLLVTVADRIRASLRSDDVVGRYGGDEFVAVCTGVPSSTVALSLGHAVLARVSLPVEDNTFDDDPVWNGREGGGRRSDPSAGAPTLAGQAVGASIGVSWTARAGVSAAQLIQLADEAMYASKRSESRVPVLAQLGEAAEIGGRRPPA